MPENPLLPNAKLRELYTLMQRTRALTKPRAATPRAEAILCSALMHVEPGDFVAAPLDNIAAALLASERTHPTSRRNSTAPLNTLPATSRLATVTGIAQAFRLAHNKRLALYFAEAGAASARAEQGWQAALTYAQTARLPLLFLCADSTGRQDASNPNALSWSSVSRLGKRLQLPVLSVDGTDAPALYRVMQEAALRARTSGGPAILWCLLPKSPTPASDPLRHMQRYLAARNLLPRR